MSPFANVRPIEILLVEDNPADVRLTQEVMKEIKVLNRMHVVSDGEEALDFLYQRGAHSGAVRPDVVILDLNLPRKNGREVLAEVKADKSLRTIPIVILTVSSAEEDVLRSYELYANCYITKPIDIEQFSKVVRAVEEFWLEIVKLPARSSGHQ